MALIERQTVTTAIPVLNEEETEHFDRVLSADAPPMDEEAKKLYAIALAVRAD